MGAWDTPPTADELRGATAAASDPWSTPPTAQESAAAKPPTGMGDVQAAPSSWAGSSNAPAALLTGDEATDNAIGQNLAAQGRRHTITAGDATRAAAVSASFLAPLAIANPIVAGAIGGGMYGAGASKADDAAGIAKDTAIGAGGGAALSGAFQLGAKGLGKLAGHAGVKAGEAIGAAAQKENAQALGELGSETGKLGGYSQDLNRKIEWVIRLLDEEKSGALSGADRAALEAFRKTPEYADILGKASQRVLATAPGAVARTTAQEAKVAQLATDLPQTVADRTTEAVSPSAAWEQVKARLLRYGPVAVGSAIGAHIGGPAGVAIGALSGAGTRPMVHALRRMAQSPAVQTNLWAAIEGLAQAGAKAPPLATPITGRAGAEGAESFLAWLRARAGGAPGSRVAPAAAGDDR